MKTSLYLFAALFFIGYSLDIKVTLKPFTVSCSGWLNTIGFVLLAAGIVCLNVDQYRKGLKRGGEISKEVLKEAIDDLKNEKHETDTPSI